MNTEYVEPLLLNKGVKPTPNRILVYKELLKSPRPVNLADLEISLNPMDKASIFRVLELFAEKELVHVIEDGSRSLKYELCHGANHHTVNDQHVHFYCEKCGEVFCFEDIAVPHVDIPVSFKIKSANYMLKGLCPKCDR